MDSENLPHPSQHTLNSRVSLPERISFLSSFSLLALVLLFIFIPGLSFANDELKANKSNDFTWETFRNRVATLAKKSRKAISLYNSVEKRGVRDFTKERVDLADKSVLCWKEVNTELFRMLSSALNISGNREFVQEVYLIRDHFYTQWRQEETKLARGIKDIELALEQRDFIRACRVAEFLAVTKANAQASEAASTELQAVLEYTAFREYQDVRREDEQSEDRGQLTSDRHALPDLPSEFSEVGEFGGVWKSKEKLPEAASFPKAASIEPANIIPITRVRSRG